jgi:cytochrome c oxidase subunit 1
MTLWLVSMAIFIASSLMGSLNYIVTVINEDKRDVNDKIAFNNLGFFFVTAYWCCFFSSFVVCLACLIF